MGMNGVLVPRLDSCWVCRHVASPEDVTVRLFSADGSRRKGRGAYTAAATYIRAMGLDRKSVV